MSKRRNRKSNQPNIPEETLRRARQEAGLEPPDPVDEAALEDEAAPQRAPAPPPEPAPVRATARRDPLPAARETAAPRKRKRRSEKVAYEEMTYEEVLELLENPTKTVTEAELHAQYGHVISDLRSMFVLAAALFIVMIVVATIVV